MSIRNKRIRVLTLVGLLGIILGCNRKTPTEPVPDGYLYRIPETSTDGWETDTLENVNISQDSLIVLMNTLNELNGDGNHSILIARNGKLVFEEYFSGYSFLFNRTIEFDRYTLHHMQSSTKGVTAILTGIAVDKGFIEDVGDSLYQFFPEYVDRFDEEKQKITLHHMLTMTSGFLWDETTYDFNDSRNDLGAMSRSNDYIGYLLDKPVVEEPGGHFLYNSGLPIALGVIIGWNTHMPADEFANEYLFAPMGITETHWVFWDDGHPHTGGGLYLRPRDMLKLGQLIAQNGTWGDEQIVSQSWIERMTTSDVLPDWYGYYWHIGDMPFRSGTTRHYLAIGSGGQEISVFPELGLVVVLTGGNYQHEFAIHPYSIYVDYILPSVDITMMKSR